MNSSQPARHLPNEKREMERWPEKQQRWLWSLPCLPRLMLPRDDQFPSVHILTGCLPWALPCAGHLEGDKANQTPWRWCLGVESECSTSQSKETNSCWRDGKFLMDEVAREWNPEGCLGFYMRKGFPGRGLSMSKGVVGKIRGGPLGNPSPRD